MHLLIFPSSYWYLPCLITGSAHVCLYCTNEFHHALFYMRKKFLGGIQYYNICQGSSTSNGMDTRGSHFVCLYTAKFLSLDHLTAVTVTVEIQDCAHRDTGCRPMHHCNLMHKSPFSVYSSPSTSERHHWTTPHCTVFPGPAPPTPDVALPTSNVAPPLSTTQPTTASRCVQLQQLDTFLFSIES